MIGNPIGYPIGGVENIALGNTGVVDVTLDDATLVATGILRINITVPQSPSKQITTSRTLSKFITSARQTLFQITE